MARYISELADYNIELRHLPGIKNRADPLSRRPNHDNGSKDNESVLVLLEELFVRVIETTALDEQIRQNQNEEIIKTWIKKGWKIHRKEDTWWKDLAIVVTNPEEIQKALMETYHDGDTAGHPGIYRTFTQIVKDYWWPDLRRYTRAYVKGCGICQQNKTNTHPIRPPLNPIFPPQEAEPFKVISIDLITKLPAS